MEKSATLLNLLYSVRDFIKTDLGGLEFPYKTENLNTDTPQTRPMNYFLQTMPLVEDQTAEVPFILLQLIAGDDEWSSSKHVGSSTATLRIVIELYDLDYTEGKLRLIGIVDKIRHDLRRQGLIDGLFQIEDPFEYLIYPDDTDCYHIAEMSTNWTMPYVERFVPELRGGAEVNNFLHPDAKTVDPGRRSGNGR